MDWIGIAVIVVIVLACPIGMHLMMRRQRAGGRHEGSGNPVAPPPGTPEGRDDRRGSTPGLS